MEFKREFLRIYLFIALILGVLGLLDAILLLSKFTIPLYGLILAILSILFFLYNVVALFVFHHHHAEKVVFVLPIYYIIIYIAAIIVSIITEISTLSQNTAYVLVAFSILTSLFEITFSLYLLRKLSLFQADA